MNWTPGYHAYLLRTSRNLDIYGSDKYEVRHPPSVPSSSPTTDDKKAREERTGANISNRLFSSTPASPSTSTLLTGVPRSHPVAPNSKIRAKKIGC